jgi:hypothetical protein
MSFNVQFQFNLLDGLVKKVGFVQVRSYLKLKINVSSIFWKELSTESFRSSMKIIY